MTFSVVIDTNTIYVGKHYNFKIIEAFNKNLIKLIEDISSNKLNSYVTILLPDIVIYELINQQSEAYYKKMNELDKFKFPDFEVKKKDDYEEHFKRYADTKISEISSKYKIKIERIPLPLNADLGKIISMAINKEAPFEGKDKESDKGFKDVILWESLVQYKKSHKNEQMILCSSDNIFKNKDLNLKYEKEFGESIFITNWNINNPNLTKLLGEQLNINVELSNEAKINEKLENNGLLENYLNYLLVDSFKINISEKMYTLKSIVSYDIVEFEELNSHHDDILLSNVYLEVLSVFKSVEALGENQTLNVSQEVTLDIILTTVFNTITNEFYITNHTISDIITNNTDYSIS